MYKHVKDGERPKQNTKHAGTERKARKRQNTQQQTKKTKNKGRETVKQLGKVARQQEAKDSTTGRQAKHLRTADGEKSRHKTSKGKPATVGEELQTGRPQRLEQSELEEIHPPLVAANY